MNKNPAAQFNQPDDFAQCKGRAGRWYCKLCTPPDRPQGQAMTLAVALRHEQENAKHLKKVAEAFANDWGYQPECNWGPKPLPVGTTAWEQSWPADRAEDFINYWLENMAKVERGEDAEAMVAFIDRFNNKYQDWADEVNQELAAWGEQGQAEEAEQEEPEPVEEWDGVKGLWYSGGSFDPRDEGFHSRGPFPPPVPRSPGSIEEDAKKLWGLGVEEDPYEVWGISRDEVTPWSNAPAPVQQGSDVTPHSSWWIYHASPAKGPQRDGRQGQTHRRGQERGGGGQKQGGIVDASAHRHGRRRNQKKTY